MKTAVIKNFVQNYAQQIYFQIHLLLTPNSQCKAVLQLCGILHCLLAQLIRMPGKNTALTFGQLYISCFTYIDIDSYIVLTLSTIFLSYLYFWLDKTTHLIRTVGHLFDSYIPPVEAFATVCMVYMTHVTRKQTRSGFRLRWYMSYGLWQRK